MRKEGQLAGYTRRRCSSSADVQQSHEQLKDSARCTRKACSNCHAVPASKALSKTKGIHNKFYNRKTRGSHTLCKFDPSFFDLHDHEPLSDAPHDEDDTFVDAYGIHYDMHDVQPDVNAHESEVGLDNDGCSLGGPVAGGLNANDDHSMHRLDARDDHHSHGCLSTALVTHNSVHDAVHFPQKQGIDGALPTHNPINDILEVNDDHLPHPEALPQCEQSPQDCEGFIAVSQSCPPIDDGGSIKWRQHESSELESDEEDWLIC